MKAGFFGAAALAAAVTIGSTAGAVVCSVNFNDSAALSRLTYSEQCISFVVTANPYGVTCPFGPAGYLGKAVEKFSPTYGHYHLVWEDPNINCFASDGCFGRMSNGVCNRVNHNAERRYVTSHTSDHWIQVAVANSADQMLVGSFRQIRIRGTNPADVWFQKNDGTWWVMRDLAPGLYSFYHPNVFRIALHQDAANGPYSFDDVLFN